MIGKSEPPSPPPSIPPSLLIERTGSFFDNISLELTRGRESAIQLQHILKTNPPNHEDLIHSLSFNITKTFANCLALLITCPVETNADLDRALSASSKKLSESKSEDSGDSYKNFAAAKDRRGCYKRRKTCESWTVETATPNADSYAWRKYGQKVILKAKHPRNYYRCTHKADQQCQATKQVQQIGEDPAVYTTVYNGAHTCRSLLKAPQIILDCNDKSDSSVNLISFDSSNPAGISFPSTMNNHENIVPMNIQNQNQNPNQCSSSITSDPTTAGSSGAYNGDMDVMSGVYSCGASPHSSFDYLMVGQDFDVLDDIEMLGLEY